MPTLSLGKVRPVYRGAYNAATAYTVLDRVSFTGTVYECVQDAAAGIAPPAEGDSAFWVILGAQGAKGDKGDKGDTGPQGPAGANGADGAQGIQGPKGEKGEKGDKGDTGMAGPQGIPGEKGADGTQGPQGPAGPQGPKGDTPPLSDAVNSTAQDVAASCKAVKTAYDKAVAAGRIPTATATVLGLVKTGTNIANSSGLISVNNASTTARGVVQLSSAVNSTSETLAATAKAVKTAYDKAVAAYDKAVAAQNAAAASGPSYNASTGKVTYPGYVGEFRNFMLATPPLGWAVRNGAVLTQADTKYPTLWAALLSGGMAFLKKTLAQWNALSQAAGGVGGVPFFVVDTTAKTIKLPDTRGDYERGAGSSYLETVGAWHPDAIRNLTGTIHNVMFYNSGSADGALSSNDGSGAYIAKGSSHWVRNIFLNISNVVSTASENRTRTFAVLPCVYVGVPT